MHRFHYWLIVILLLGLFLTASYLVLEYRFEAGTGLPEYSVYSREENGLGTAAQVLRQLGFQPVAMTRPPQVLRQRGVLLVVEPEEQSVFGLAPGLSEADSQGLLDWVDEGNTLVLCTANLNPLHKALGVNLAISAAAQPVLVQALEVGGYTEPTAVGGTMPVQHLGIEKTVMLQGKEGAPLWLVGDQAGALLVPHGRGRVLVLPDPSLFTHRGLVRGDNVLFLYNIARMDAVDGRVLFDEYHHGIRSGGSYTDYLRYYNLHWMGLQFLAALGLVLWAAGVRLGPPVPLPPPPRADAVDYASAVARIYQRAGVLRETARHIARDFLAALTRYLHLNRTASLAEVLQTWRQRYGADSAGEVIALVEAAENLREPRDPARRWSRRELLHWARTFDEFIRRITAPSPR